MNICKCNILLQGITCCAENICRCNLFGSNCRVKKKDFFGFSHNLSQSHFCFHILDWILWNLSAIALTQFNKNISKHIEYTPAKFWCVWLLQYMNCCLVPAVWAFRPAINSWDKSSIDKNSLQRKRKAVKNIFIHRLTC